MLALDHVEKSYPGGVAALRSVTVDIATGDRVAVVGPSGSGKTTMLMIIAGLERVTKGRVSVAGTDYANMDEDKLALFRRDAIGIVFQSF
ncbi:MAG: ATP-binding cassette domain-containing protein, partial [Solirubrobacteraceae bacterium]